MIVIAAFICGFLWGSAFPCVKIGYRLFSVAADDTASQLLFAGIRFTLAGVLVILFGSIGERRLLLPAGIPAGSPVPAYSGHSSGTNRARNRILDPIPTHNGLSSASGSGKSAGRISPDSIKMIIILSAFQTIGQYFFFYIGMAHASGVKASITEASSTFFAILIAALVFHTEKLNYRKIIGCLVGFAGVLVILIPGNTLDFHVSFNGEGFILISTLMYAMSSSVMKQYSRREDTFVLSGYQFIFGGIVLTAAGALMGGHLSGFTPASTALLLYMSFISAAAYTLWSILLRHNPVSRIAVFGFINPVMGAILSALLLGEQNQAFSVYGLLSLVLVTAGIVIVYRLGETGDGSLSPS